MDAHIQQARSKMLNTETTTTPKYEQQRHFLKSYTDISRNVNNAMQRAAKALNEYMNSMQVLHRSYEQVIGLGNHHETLVAMSGDLGKVLTEWKEAVFPKFERLMQEECLAGFPSLMAGHVRVEALRQDRRKLAETYDYYKKEVLEKEKEYQKKNKLLTQSQTYTATVLKMEEAQKQFEGVSKAFDTEATNLMFRKDVVTAHTLQCSMEHFSGVLGVLHTQFDRIFRLAAVHTHHIEGNFPTTKEQIAAHNSQRRGQR